mmetsp:Transcript_31924/g.74732  ORF Transcript_31924/g.74732 Transcript_31924/m.74732 type:complete len:196 (-) Transcript_31924:1-588(-)
MGWISCRLTARTDHIVAAKQRTTADLFTIRTSSSATMMSVVKKSPDITLRRDGLSSKRLPGQSKTEARNIADMKPKPRNLQEARKAFFALRRSAGGATLRSSGGFRLLSSLEDGTSVLIAPITAGTMRWPCDWALCGTGVRLCVVARGEGPTLDRGDVSMLGIPAKMLPAMSQSCSHRDFYFCFFYWGHLPGRHP